MHDESSKGEYNAAVSLHSYAPMRTTRWNQSSSYTATVKANALLQSVFLAITLTVNTTLHVVPLGTHLNQQRASISLPNLITPSRWIQRCSPFSLVRAGADAALQSIFQVSSNSRVALLGDGLQITAWRQAFGLWPAAKRDQKNSLKGSKKFFKRDQKNSFWLETKKT